MPVDLEDSVFLVYLKDFCFLPDVIEVEIDGLIEFRNEDRVDHILQCKGMEQFPKVKIKPLSASTFSFPSPGRYEMSSREYGEMKCIIEVSRKPTEKTVKKLYFPTSKDKKIARTIETKHLKDKLAYESDSTDYRDNEFSLENILNSQDKWKSQTEQSSSSSDTECERAAWRNQRRRLKSRHEAIALSYQRDKNLERTQIKPYVLSETIKTENVTKQIKEVNKDEKIVEVSVESKPLSPRPVKRNGRVFDVMIQDFEFSVSSAVIFPGQSVRFCLSSDVPYHVEHQLLGESSVLPLCFESPVLQQGKQNSYVFIPMESGLINVSCKIFPELRCSLHILTSTSHFPSFLPKSQPSLTLEGTAQHYLSVSIPSRSGRDQEMFSSNESQSSFYDSDDVFTASEEDKKGRFSPPTQKEDLSLLQVSFEEEGVNEESSLLFVDIRDDESLGRSFSCDSFEKAEGVEGGEDFSSSCKYQVEIDGYQFRPNILNVKLGERVRFYRLKTVSSSVTALSNPIAVQLSCEGEFFTPLAAPKDGFSFVHEFWKAGVFPVKNEIYSFMICTINVTEPDNKPPMSPNRSIPKLFGTFSPLMQPCVAPPAPVFSMPVEKSSNYGIAEKPNHRDSKSSYVDTPTKPLPPLQGSFPPRSNSGGESKFCVKVNGLPVQADWVENLDDASAGGSSQFSNSSQLSKNQRRRKNRRAKLAAAEDSLEIGVNTLSPQVASGPSTIESRFSSFTADNLAAMEKSPLGSSPSPSKNRFLAAQADWAVDVEVEEIKETTGEELQLLRLEHANRSRTSSVDIMSDLSRDSKLSKNQRRRRNHRERLAAGLPLPDKRRGESPQPHSVISSLGDRTVCSTLSHSTTEDLGDSAQVSPLGSTAHSRTGSLSGAVFSEFIEGRDEAHDVSALKSKFLAASVDLSFEVDGGVETVDEGSGKGKLEEALDVEVDVLDKSGFQEQDLVEYLQTRDERESEIATEGVVFEGETHKHTKNQKKKKSKKKRKSSLGIQESQEENNDLRINELLVTSVEENNKREYPMESSQQENLSVVESIPFVEAGDLEVDVNSVAVSKPLDHKESKDETYSNLTEGNDGIVGSLLIGSIEVIVKEDSVEAASCGNQNNEKEIGKVIEDEKSNKDDTLSIIQSSEVLPSVNYNKMSDSKSSVLLKALGLKPKIKKTVEIELEEFLTQRMDCLMDLFENGEQDTLPKGKRVPIVYLQENENTNFSNNEEGVKREKSNKRKSEKENNESKNLQIELIKGENIIKSKEKKIRKKGNKKQMKILV